MNYGEEYGFWYLRLNGFFPISNFVIHRSTRIKYTSDCDLLAVRPPFVYEDIGGRSEDWDQELTRLLDFNRTIGVICEVKTGRYKANSIFNKENVKYSISRLGFVSQDNLDELASKFENKPIINVGDNYQLIKLLIAEKGTREANNQANYHFKSMGTIVDFLKQRVSQYPKEKYASRMYFGSILFQNIIDSSVLKR